MRVRWVPQPPERVPAPARPISVVQWHPRSTSVGRPLPRSGSGNRARLFRPGNSLWIRRSRVDLAHLGRGSPSVLWRWLSRIPRGWVSGTVGTHENEDLLTERPTLAFHARATTLRPIWFVNSRSSVQIRVSAPLPRFVLRKPCYLVCPDRSGGPCRLATTLVAREDLLTGQDRRALTHGPGRPAPRVPCVTGPVEDLLSCAQPGDAMVRPSLSIR